MLRLRLPIIFARWRSSLAHRRNRPIDRRTLFLRRETTFPGAHLFAFEVKLGCCALKFGCFVTNPDSSAMQSFSRTVSLFVWMTR
jgi:hypothetical protein